MHGKRCDPSGDTCLFYNTKKAWQLQMLAGGGMHSNGSGVTGLLEDVLHIPLDLPAKNVAPGALKLAQGTLGIDIIPIKISSFQFFIFQNLIFLIGWDGIRYFWNLI